MRCGVFVTGTGTGVGKTVVAAALLRALRRRGFDAIPMKPVQTGGSPGPNGLSAPDLDTSLGVADLGPDPPEYTLMAPYVYEPACSPHLAGRMDGNDVQAARILQCADRLLKSHDALVVEGAGGVLVPINAEQTMLDLMVALGLPVVLVGLPGLGTINHSLLSIHALRGAGLGVLGIIFCQPEPLDHDFITSDNPKTIAKFGRVEILGSIGYHQDLSPSNQTAWDAIEHEIHGLDAIANRLKTGP